MNLSQEVALAGIFLISLWVYKTKKSISWVLDVLRSCFEPQNDSKLNPCCAAPGIFQICVTVRVDGSQNIPDFRILLFF